MAGIFTEGGVPANQTENAQEGLKTVNDVTCPPRFYSMRCTATFDPTQANAVISELANVAMKARVDYDCGRLNNTELSVRYLDQEAKANGAPATGGPISYNVTLDPPLRAYQDYVPVRIVPQQSCRDAPTLNVNGLGARPIYRNDGVPIRRRDLETGVPITLIYHSGKWWVDGLATSQVQIIPESDIDGWVRPDGSDDNDGTANTPDKAFRTIAGAWRALAMRYAVNPSFKVYIRLGIPGVYEGGVALASGGFEVVLIGDINKQSEYIIQHPTTMPTNSDTSVLYITGMTVQVVGVTLRLNRDSWASGVSVQLNGNVLLRNTTFELGVNISNARRATFLIVSASGYAQMRGNIKMNVNGYNLGAYKNLMEVSNGNLEIGYSSDPCTLTVSNSPGEQNFMWVYQLSSVKLYPGAYIAAENVDPNANFGGIGQNSVLEMQGISSPVKPAYALTGGQVITE